MRKPWNAIHFCLMIGGLLLSTGCGSRSQENATTSPSSPGTSAGNPAIPAGQTQPVSTALPGRLAQAPVDPEVLMETSMGNITLRLNSGKAPATVANFLSYVESGFYDNTIFHKVGKDYVILGGTYDPNLKPKQAGPPIRNEANGGLKNVRGAIAMAREANSIASATSQFFINLSDNPSLDYHESATGTVRPEDYGYCVFGQVIDGMDAVDRIANVPVEDKDDFERKPVQPVIVKSVRKIR